MAEGRLKLEPEVQEILNHIDNNRNFLLSGGAGSGKTYSLVQVIRQVIKENPTKKVACMTYTNAAVKEIKDRVSPNNLDVSTIHDFLWDKIKHFQKELKDSLIALANDIDSKITIDEDKTLPINYFDSLEKGIQYKEYVKFKEGIISHDELLIIASYIFENFPKLSTIVKDEYPFIFIDEYQDTSKSVIDIFLNHFKKSDKSSVIGFFGDAMQSIYDDGIGNLDEYKGSSPGLVEEVTKSQNRRNPIKVIALANRLRTDGLIQEPSNDKHAPNMANGQIKEGNILFIHSKSNDVSAIKSYLTEKCRWSFENTEQTKELNLTHNLIADKAGFRTIMDIYNKDQILSYRNRIKKHIKDKGITTDFSKSTFEEVIKSTGVLPTPSMKTFIEDNPDLFELALKYNYAAFSKVYVSKDQLLDDKKQNQEEDKKGSVRDALIKHLFKIQRNIDLYKTGQYNEFLRTTDYKYQINTIADKRELKTCIDQLINVGNKTIEQVINDAHKKNICVIDDRLERFKEKSEYLFGRVKDVRFNEFQKLHTYLEGKTPFSTKHKTKGNEFDSVFVILDNGRWRNYDFKNLFLREGSPSVLLRTQKIFYVCCTRAKKNLAVFYHDPGPDVIEKATELFGHENIVSL
jgi:DNA helicase II / ATP-dependent DNA helicase PcrA